MAQILKNKKPIEQTRKNYETDSRFRKLLPDTAWNLLPKAVQKRFTKKVTGNNTVVFSGKSDEVRMSWLGQMFANIARVIGAPLPLRKELDMPSVVSVTEDVVKGGQTWTRLYATRHGFPQIIHSAKRFRGHTGLEEYIGYGISIALKVGVDDGVLTFESDGLIFELFNQRIRVPDALIPFDLTIRHQNIDDEQFYFYLELSNAIFGELIYQKVLYREMSEL